MKHTKNLLPAKKFWVKWGLLMAFMPIVPASSASDSEDSGGSRLFYEIQHKKPFSQLPLTKPSLPGSEEKIVSNSALNTNGVGLFPRVPVKEESENLEIRQKTQT